ncbi:hypothetical protein ACLMJK_004665 [Lecanora helva]
MISLHAILLNSLCVVIAQLAYQAGAINPSAPPSTSNVLFSANVGLGKALPPVPIPGGQRVVEPITGGIVNGSLINATIAGGLAYPRLLSNGTIEDAEIIIYGQTVDNSSYFVTIAGIGIVMGQIARVNFEIGGKYAALADELFVATVVPSKDRTTVKVDGYELS